MATLKAKLILYMTVKTWLPSPGNPEKRLGRISGNSAVKFLQFLHCLCILALWVWNIPVGSEFLMFANSNEQKATPCGWLYHCKCILYRNTCLLRLFVSCGKKKKNETVHEASFLCFQWVAYLSRFFLGGNFPSEYVAWAIALDMSLKIQVLPRSASFRMINLFIELCMLFLWW